MLAVIRGRTPAVNSCPRVLTDLVPMFSPHQPFALWSVILSGVALTIWLESRFRWAESVGGPTLGLVIAGLISNLGVMPAEADTYDLSSLVILPIAIPLLLFRASLVRIYREARFMLLAFLLCCIGTVLGTTVAYLLLRNHVEHAAEIAGVETASNIGGSVNFMAVREAFGLDATITSGLLVVDNIAMVSVFLVLFRLAGSSIFRRTYGTMVMDAPAKDKPGQLASSPFSARLSLRDLSLALAAAFVIAAAGHHFAPPVQEFVRKIMPPSAATFGLDQVFGNKYVLISTLSVLAATFLRSSLGRLEGIQELGVYLLYVYLFTLGLPANVRQLTGTAPALFTFCLIVAGANLLFALVAGKLCRIPAEPLLLTVNATVGGPSTAAAMAGSCRWGELVLPAILVGLLGYAVATPIGIALGRALLAWTG